MCNEKNYSGHGGHGGHGNEINGLLDETRTKMDYFFGHGGHGNKNNNLQGVSTLLIAREVKKRENNTIIDPNIPL